MVLPRLFLWVSFSLYLMKHNTPEMGILLEKRPNGSVRITKSGRKSYLNALTDVKIYAIHEDTYPEIVVESRSTTTNFLVSDIESINGVNTPTNLNDVIDLLGELFKFGGGNGTGVAVVDITTPIITSNPPAVVNLASGDTWHLEVAYVAPNESNVKWYGSIDGGLTYPFMNSTDRIWTRTVNSEDTGTYRATIFYAGGQINSTPVTVNVV